MCWWDKNESFNAPTVKTTAPLRVDTSSGFTNRAFTDDAGSEVLRRAGFFDIRSGSSEYLRTGVGVMKPSANIYPRCAIKRFVES